MAPTVTLGAWIARASATRSVDAIQAIHRTDVHALVARPADRLGTPVAWVRPLEVLSAWEQSVLAVLFLLITGLIVIRFGGPLDRDLERTVSAVIGGADGDSGESEQGGDSVDQSNETPRDTHEAPHGSTEDPRRYERYLSPETPPELLSDEGKVVRLLVENHGQIRQHQITEETGWSKSKVSRICSQMHDDDVVEKRSAGRENIITLSEAESTETGGRDDPDRSGDVENPIP